MPQHLVHSVNKFSESTSLCIACDHPHNNSLPYCLLIDRTFCNGSSNVNIYEPDF